MAEEHAQDNAKFEELPLTDVTTPVGCGCGSECQCAEGHCDCDSHAECACGGGKDGHICPVCGMPMDSTGECACVLKHHDHSFGGCGCGRAYGCGCGKKKHGHSSKGCACEKQDGGTKGCGCGKQKHHGHHGHGACGCGNKKHAPAHLTREQAAALGVVVIADLTLKVLAVRRALKRNDKGWVLPLAFINTAGILPGTYLLTHRAPGK